MRAIGKADAKLVHSPFFPPSHVLIGSTQYSSLQKHLAGSASGLRNLRKLLKSITDIMTTCFMICNQEISIPLLMYPEPNVQTSTMVPSIVLIFHIEPYSPHQCLKDTFIYPFRISQAGALIREACFWHSYRA